MCAAERLPTVSTESTLDRILRVHFAPSRSTHLERKRKQRREKSKIFNSRELPQSKSPAQSLSRLSGHFPRKPRSKQNTALAPFPSVAGEAALSHARRDALQTHFRLSGQQVAISRSVDRGCAISKFNDCGNDTHVRWARNKSTEKMLATHTNLANPNLPTRSK